MTHLKKGDVAPNFSGIIENGETIRLSDFRGKKVALYFYPKDNTPTCTVEACNLRDGYSDLIRRGIEVIGVSPDSEERHQKFISKHRLPFHLIADVDKKIALDYGVWGPKKFMGRLFDGIHRTTFIIDENGKIESVIDAVKSKIHTKQILEATQ